MIVVLGAEQAEEHRQRDLPAAQAAQLDDEHDHDPAVPPPSPAAGPLRLRPVVQIVRPEHLAPRTAEQGVVNGETDRRARLHEHGDQEVQQRQPQFIGIPAPAGEQVVRAAVMPHPSQPRGLQHPRHRAIPDPADRPYYQPAERLKRRLRHAWRQQGQQPSQRSGNLKHGGDLPDGKPADFNLAENTMRYLVFTPPQPGYDYKTFDFDRDTQLLDEWSKLAKEANISID